MSWSSLPITVLLKLKSCHGLSILHCNLGRHGWARPCPWSSSGENASYLAGPHVLPAGCGLSLDPVCLCTLLTAVWDSSWVILTPNSYFQSMGADRKGKEWLLKSWQQESSFRCHIPKSTSSIKMVEESSFYWGRWLAVAIKWTRFTPLLSLYLCVCTCSLQHVSVGDLMTVISMT